ncbi:MAG: hypothetical protein ACR2M1_10390 [Gemmatimonadaceae bacterium]
MPRARYLQFHIEAYFHEIYILRERLEAFGKRATRAYKKSARRDLAIDVAGQLEHILSALEDVVAIRGHHVHELRFQETRLSNLAAIELIERNSIDPVWPQFLREQYPAVRRYWISWIKEMNAAVEELLDKYFAQLHLLMFDRRQFQFPRGAT